MMASIPHPKNSHQESFALSSPPSRSCCLIYQVLINEIQRKYPEAVISIPGYTIRNPLAKVLDSEIREPNKEFETHFSHHCKSLLRSRKKRIPKPHFYSNPGTKMTFRCWEEHLRRHNQSNTSLPLSTFKSQCSHEDHMHGHKHLSSMTITTAITTSRAIHS